MYIWLLINKSLHKKSLLSGEKYLAHSLKIDKLQCLKKSVKKKDYGDIIVKFKRVLLSECVELVWRFI